MTEVDIVNLALVHLGITQPIVDLDEESLEAEVAARVFEHCRDQVLGDFSWPFAEGHEVLDVAVLGDEDTLATPEWNFAYAIPATALKVRRLTITGMRATAEPPEYTIGRFNPADATAWSAVTAYVAGDIVSSLGIAYLATASGTNHQPPDALYWRVLQKVILTDQEPHEDLWAIFTVALTDTEEFDAEFVNALSFKLAAKMAPGLARDVKVIQFCEAKYAQAILSAQAVHAGEAKQDAPLEAEWVRDR